VREMRMAFVGLTLLALTLTACGLQAGTPEPTEAAAGLPDDVERAAKGVVSAEEDVPVRDITVVDAEYKEWPNSCLGLAEPEEMCLQVITPGYKVTLRAEGETYVLHTNQDGTAVRME